MDLPFLNHTGKVVMITGASSGVHRVDGGQTAH